MMTCVSTVSFKINILSVVFEVDICGKVDIIFISILKLNILSSKILILKFSNYSVEPSPVEVYSKLCNFMNYKQIIIFSYLDIFF